MVLTKSRKHFYEVFTDFQCYILANMHKGDFNGVTATHYNIVEYICRKGKTTGTKIAADFGVSQAAISRQVRFLVTNRFLEQKQREEDRRVYALQATDKGRALINTSESFRTHVTKQAHKLLSQKELTTLTALLAKVLEGIKP
ncbi:MarR family winged helix-turn-helix transcriptional regulator [Niabella pedocola]|uniref:MarR family winged helix-turn-helix transcriptional regulator n=1 Tax=Niabella pedocola TaxID=1752077 RepID=A0ABS8PNT9_9BACT|nr:MarR family winged helix-turn-helix transcriptional regulator [Niabella pedocola]MCD2422775.1 MarR family winged helix-turn-helix transcriptional regulator [Niabella pedocola]